MKIVGNIEDQPVIRDGSRLYMLDGTNSFQLLLFSPTVSGQEQAKLMAEYNKAVKP